MLESSCDADAPEEVPVDEVMRRFPAVLRSTTRAALFMSLLMDNMARELMSLQVFLTPSSLKKISQRDGDLGDITRYWT